MKISKFLDDLFDQPHTDLTFDMPGGNDLLVQYQEDGAPFVHVDTYMGAEDFRKAAKLFKRLADALDVEHG